MKALRVRSGTATLILNLGTELRGQLQPCRKNPGTHGRGGGVGPRTVLDVLREHKISIENRTLVRPTYRLVTIPTELQAKR